MRIEDVKMTRPMSLTDEPADPRSLYSFSSAISDFRMIDVAWELNECLRQGKPVSELADPNAGLEGMENYYHGVQDLHDTLLRLSNQSYLRQNLTLYRGQKTSERFALGELVHFAGWTSTTLNREWAASFANYDYFSGYPTLMTLECQSGTHVINTLEDDIEEFVLPPGTSARVISTEWVNGLQLVTVRV